MPRKRSTYTAEFKLQAVKMIVEQKLAVAEVARRLDVGENLLRTWRTAFEEQGAAAFPGHGTPSPADDELRRLRAENARLRAERDLLKKAAAYFANPPS
jgi:transposase